MKKRYISSNKLLSIAAAVVCVLFIVVLVTLNAVSQKHTQESFDDSMLLFMEGQLERLYTIDKLYYSLEKLVDPTMEEVLNNIKTDYEKTGRLDKELNRYVIKDKHLNVYVFDQNNRIIDTTDSVDLGVCFGKNNHFLERIRENNTYYSPRMTLQSNTSKLMKFSYIPSTDGKYIFEVGYDMKKFDAVLETDSICEYESSAVKLNNNIQGFKVFSGNLKKSVDGKVSVKEDFDTGRKAAFEEAIKTSVYQRYNEISNAYQTTYLYIPYQQYLGDAHYHTLVLEMIYSNASIHDEIYGQIRKQILLVAILLLCVISIQLYFNQSVISPIDKMLIAFQEIKNKNFNTHLEFATKNKGLNEAKETFNEMVKNVRNLLREKDIREKLLEKTLKEKEQNYFETIKALVNAIDAKDGYTAGHCDRVTKLSLMLGRYMEFDKETMESLRYGSILHDIGKIGIADSILKKNGRLTFEEYQAIKKHPEIGYNIIKDINFLKGSKHIVYYHHERIDGKGYPLGLKGDEIPYLAKILSITDAFDAMTSKRVYREHRMTVKEAFEEMRRHRGMQFDSIILELFIEAYQEEYGGDIDQKADKVEALA